MFVYAQVFIKYSVDFSSLFIFISQFYKTVFMLIANDVIDLKSRTDIDIK